MKDPIPKELCHQIHKKMQNNNKQGKYITLWILLSMLAKINVKENAGVDPEAQPSLDFGMV